MKRSFDEINKDDYNDYELGYIVDNFQEVHKAFMKYAEYKSNINLINLKYKYDHFKNTLSNRTIRSEAIDIIKEFIYHMDEVYTLNINSYKPDVFLNDSSQDFENNLKAFYNKDKSKRQK